MRQITDRGTGLDKACPLISLDQPRSDFQQGRLLASQRRHSARVFGCTRSYSSLAGISADNLVELIDKNEAQVEASGVNLLSYISPGSDHTILSKPDLYTHEVNGVRLIDWITRLIDGDPTLADNHCTDCGSAG